MRWFIDGQVLGWCLLATLAAVCCAALFLLFRVLGRQSAASAVVWTWCTAGASLVLAGVRMAMARHQILAVLLQDVPPESSKSARLVAENLSRVVMTQLFTSSVLAVAMLVLFVAALRKPSKVPQRWLFALAAGLLMLTMAAARFENPYASSSCLYAPYPACWFELASHSVVRMQRAARYVVGAGALGWVVALVAALRAARNGVKTDGRVTVACTALLLAGIGAFWATRAEHADTRHLVPPDVNVARSWTEERLRAQLPTTKRDCAIVEAPLIEFRTNVALIDGVERTTPEELGATLASKRQLWEQLNPNSKFPGLVALAAERGMKPAAMLPWVLAAGQAGFEKIGALLQGPTVAFQTSTVGVLQLEHECMDVWKLDAAVWNLRAAGIRRAFTYFDTWGELAAASGIAPPDPYPRRSEISRCGSLSAPASPAAASLLRKARRVRNQDELQTLMNQGKSGSPERIALHISGNGGALCECPPFSILMSDPDAFEPDLLAVSMNGAPNVGLNRTLLNFIVVGYFSGAWIDSYEYLHLEGDDEPVTDDETRSSYTNLAAEFCLEASCYYPRYDLVGDYRVRGAEDAADMVRVGIPRCRGQ